MWPSEKSSKEPQVQHHKLCCSTHRCKHPGSADPKFQENHEVRSAEFPKFNEYLKCFGCCLAYLKTERGYRTKVEYSSCNNHGYVHFCSENVKPEGTWCNIKFPSGRGKTGQLFTEVKSKVTSACRSVENSRTYQIYTTDGEIPEGIGTGFSAYVRLESVAVNKVERADLSNINMNYADAVLLERYRELYGITGHGQSFEGCCVIFEDMEKLEKKLGETGLNDQKPNLPATGDPTGV